LAVPSLAVCAAIAGEGNTAPAAAVVANSRKLRRDNVMMVDAWKLGEQPFYAVGQNTPTFVRRGAADDVTLGEEEAAPQGNGSHCKIEFPSQPAITCQGDEANNLPGTVGESEFPAGTSGGRAGLLACAGVALLQVPMNGHRRPDMVPCRWKSAGAREEW